MRAPTATLLILLSSLAGCMGSDDSPPVEAAAADPAGDEAPMAILDPETGAPLPADRVRMVEWRDALAPKPGATVAPLESHVRVGAGALMHQSDAFVGRLAAGTLTLTWEDAYASSLELRILVGTRHEGWTELARAAGASPVTLEWPGEDAASETTRHVLLRVESADRGAGPLEARAPSTASFAVEGALVVDGTWTARHVD